MTALRVQRWCELLFALVVGLLAAQVVRTGWDRGFDVGEAVFGVLLVVLACGLARSWMPARRTAAVLCLLLALAIPIANSPFSAGDQMAAGITPPSIAEILVWLIPMEIFLLVAAYVLDLRIPAAAQAPVSGTTSALAKQ